MMPPARLWRELLRTPSTRTSQNYPSETVWKIAGRPLEGALLAPGGANRLLFAPSWRPYSPRFGTHSEFPNSFGRGILGSSFAGSCIALVLWCQKHPIAPVLHTEVTLHLVVLNVYT